MNASQAILRAIAYTAMAQGLKPKSARDLDQAMALLEKAKQAEPKTFEPELAEQTRN